MAAAAGELGMNHCIPSVPKEQTEHSLSAKSLKLKQAKVMARPESNRSEKSSQRNTEPSLSFDLLQPSSRSGSAKNGSQSAREVVSFHMCLLVLGLVTPINLFTFTILLCTLLHLQAFLAVFQFTSAHAILDNT